MPALTMLTFCVGCDWSTGGIAADGRHLTECLSLNLSQVDGWLDKGHKEVLGQLLWCLTVEEGIQEAPKAIIVNILAPERKGKEKGKS